MNSNERGSILLFAVWVVMFLCILTASLAGHGAQEIRLMRREVLAFQERRELSSSLQEVVDRINSDPDPHEDSREESWFGQIKPGLSVEDEESKINLNQVSAVLLGEFFKEFEDEIGPLKGKRKEYVKGILKLRYEKRIECLEELFLMEGFRKEDLPALRKYVTVYPENPFVNINTASPLVLRTLVLSLGADRAAKQMVLSRLEEGCRSNSCYFLTEELEPEKFAEKLKLPKTPLILQALQELAAKLTTDSMTFHAEIAAKEARASAVFRVFGTQRAEVLYWHEKV